MGDRQDSRALRVPPHSVEAEQAVLGGLMLVPEALDQVSDLLREEDFFRRDHRLIWRAIHALADRGRPFDAVTLAEWFDAHQLSEQVDDGRYLIKLASNTPSAANIEAYAQIVREKALLRRMIEAGTEIVSAGFQPDGREVGELLAEAEQRVFALSGAVTTGAATTGTDSLREAAKEIATRRAAGPNALLGISTSLRDLDRMTMGLQGGDLIIVAARPSIGKTALALQLRRAAAMAGHRPLKFSLEMPGKQLAMRDIAAVGKVDFGHVRNPAHATPEEMEQMRNAIRTMREWQWWVDDTPSLSVRQIVSRARRMKRQYDIGLILIDYLQFIDLGNEMSKGLGVVQAIQEVTRSLKALARELNVPVVLLSQLNRKVEERGDKRPILADLRESGAIEQDADVVMLLHREGYYQRDRWHADDPRHNTAEIIIAKQRNGEVGKIEVAWRGKRQLFGDINYSNVTQTYQERKRGFEPIKRDGLVKAVQSPHDDE